MSFRIHVLKVNTIKGKAKSTGNDYEMNIVEAILDHKGEQSICEFVLPKDHATPKPGVYEADMEPVVDRREKRLVGEISNLRSAKPAGQV